MKLLFLSFTTLSGVGLGDVVPISSWGSGLTIVRDRR